MNEKTGRLKDILFEDCASYASDGTYQIINGMFVVWADENLLELISKVTGVIKVFKERETRYVAYFDPRYDKGFVQREIEAFIKIQID